MKKVLSVLLCAVLLISLLSVSAFAADSNKIILTADKTEVNPGDEVVISISIESTEACDQFGLMFDFDRDVFDCVKVVNNATLDDEDGESLIAVKAKNEEAGKEGVAISFYSAQVYSGRVGKLTLKVKDGAEFDKTVVTAQTSCNLGANAVELGINEVEISMIPEATEAPTTEATEAPTEHVHTWVEYAAVEPTCDTEGNVAYKQCSECGEAWTLGENPMPLSKYGWVLGAIGHTWVDHAAVEPTCTADGNIAYQQCSVCGAAQTAGENPVPLSKFGWVLAAAHTGLEHHEAIEPICGTDGHEAFDYCNDCQVFIYEDPLKLSYQDGVIPAVEHAWVEYAAVEPNCDTDGNVAYKQCTNCGEAWTMGENPMPLSKYGWVLGAIGHTWVDHAAVEPTCTADGNIAYQQCSVCGAAQTAGENPIPLSKDGWVLAAAHTALEHHDAIEASCGIDGHEAFDYCTNCQVFIYADPLKLSYQDGVIPALTHEWVEHEAVAPSCNAEGNIAYAQCTNCGAAQTVGENPIPLAKYGWVLGPTGEHTMEHYDAIEATCDTDGHEAFDYCTTCECFFYEDALKLTYQAGVIPALGHTWVEHEAVAPTCFEPGNIAYAQCSVCGAAQTAGENPIPLSKDGWILGVAHNIKHVEAKAATVEAEGNVEYWYCEDCGYAWLDENMTLVTNLKSVITPKLPAPETPVTGDETPVVALIVVAVMATFGLALVVANKKRFTA